MKKCGQKILNAMSISAQEAVYGILWARNLQRKPNNYVSEEPRQNKGRRLVDRKLVEASFSCPPSPK